MLEGKNRDKKLTYSNSFAKMKKQGLNFFESFFIN